MIKKTFWPTFSVGNPSLPCSVLQSFPTKKDEYFEIVICVRL